MAAAYAAYTRSFAFALSIATALACASGRYRVEARRIDCEDANAQAYRALVDRQYEILRFEPAAPGRPGVVEARRATPDEVRRGSVRILCGRTIAFQPVEGAWFLPNFEFSREMYYALVALGGGAASGGVPGAPGAGATPVAVAASAPTGPPVARAGRLETIMRVLDRFEIRKALGVDLEGGGLVVVYVAIINGSTRDYTLPANGVAVIDDQGERAAPLAGAAIGDVLTRSMAAPPAPDAAPRPSLDIPAAVRALDAHALSSGRVPAGSTRSGYLYFPARAYRSGRLRLVDDETGEVEGAVVGF